MDDQLRLLPLEFLADGFKIKELKVRSRKRNSLEFGSIKRCNACQVETNQPTRPGDPRDSLRSQSM